MATSRRRPMARINNKLATLAHAISSTNTTAPSNTHNDSRIPGPTSASAIGTSHERLPFGRRIRKALTINSESRREPRTRLLEAHAGAQPRRNLQIISLLRGVEIEPKRQPQVHAPELTQIELGARDAEDGVRSAGERDRRAEDGRIAAEPPLPETRGSARPSAPRPAGRPRERTYGRRRAAHEKRGNTLPTPAWPRRAPARRRSRSSPTCRCTRPRPRTRRRARAKARSWPAPRRARWSRGRPASSRAAAAYPGSANGTGLSTTALTTENTAVLAAMPTASTAIAVTANSGWSRQARSACTKSCSKAIVTCQRLCLFGLHRTRPPAPCLLGDAPILFLAEAIQRFLVDDATVEQWIVRSA